MNAILSQAIEQTFPKLSKDLQEKIDKKVSLHMFAIFQDEIFRDDPDGLKACLEKAEMEPDKDKRSQLYTAMIEEKFIALPSDKQTVISQKLASELTRVMHEIYKAYE